MFKKEKDLQGKEEIPLQDNLIEETKVQEEKVLTEEKEKTENQKAIKILKDHLTENQKEEDQALVEKIQEKEVSENNYFFLTFRPLFKRFSIPRFLFLFGLFLAI